MFIEEKKLSLLFLIRETNIFTTYSIVYLHLHNTQNIYYFALEQRSPHLRSSDPDYYDRRGLRGEISVVASLSGETPRDVLYRTQKYWP